MRSPAPAAGPRPLAAWPAQERRRIAGVFTDIDDTLTRDGCVEPVALDALRALREAGLRVIAVTGRPAGWTEPAARDWPLDALVAENGGLAWVPVNPDPTDQKRRQPGTDAVRLLQKTYSCDAPTRAAQRRRLDDAIARVARELPQLRLTRDHDGRETDIAFDIGEFEAPAPDAVAALRALLLSLGLSVTQSSIHLHGRCDGQDKWRGACWLARTRFGVDLTAEPARWVAVGDSGNDEPLFAGFLHSVGVANIGPWLDRLSHRPRWITRAERGAGFAELAAALLAAR